MTDPISVWRRLACTLVVALLTPALGAQTPTRPVRNGDYIVAVVNQELVTAAELENRLARIHTEAERTRQQLPPPDVLRRQVLEQLIDERVQVTNARENGPRIDDAELDRAVNSVAVQNQMTVAQMRQRIRQEGLDFAKFRDNIRDQMLVERVREREVNSRIRVTDAEIDAFLQERRAAAGMAPQLDIAQILVTVPEGASDAVVAERRARAEAAQARVRAGEDFAKVAREMSEDGNRAEGGAIGLKPADRLPDLFVAAVKDLRPGEVTPELLRSGAGFHLLKLLDRRDAAFTVQQTHVRHILLRLSDRDRSFTYCILEAPIPLIDYVATVRLKPVTDGNATFWDGSFAGFARIIAGSSLYVGYDSAGQHVAAACGVPLISIFAGFPAPRMFHRWRPTGARTTVIRVDRPEPAEILARVARALAEIHN